MIYRPLPEAIALSRKYYPDSGNLGGVWYPIVCYALKDAPGLKQTVRAVYNQDVFACKTYTEAYELAYDFIFGTVQ